MTVKSNDGGDYDADDTGDVDLGFDFHTDIILINKVLINSN